MAAADYKLCDVCGKKAFYDANLNYENGPPDYREQAPFRVAGKEQYSDADAAQKYGYRLDYLGDWAVICDDCAKTHKCVVLPYNAK